jgi:hypothetical protein
MSEYLTILSVNVNRSLVTLTALLETADTDILLIQEPYWGPLVPLRSDTDPDGTKVTGTMNHRGWRAFHPSPTDGAYPHVATFVRQKVATTLTIIPSPIIDTYYALGLTLTLSLPLRPITLINFYHHVEQKRARLEELLCCTIPCDEATLLCGDFNTHSTLWSPGNIRPSIWADSLEEWLDSENLVLLVPDGSITWRRGSNKPSLIDLILGNPAFLEVLSFPCECSVSFDLSIGSDHAGLLLALPLSLPPPPTTNQSGWRVDDKKKDEWIAAFSALAPNPDHISNEASLKECAAALQEAIAEVSNRLFP